MIKKQPILRTIAAAVVMGAIASGAAIFIYRYQILQYSAEKIVRKFLPDYITIDKMGFNFRGNKIILGGFKILNPPNFAHKYLIEIGEMTCGYKMKGKTILDGIEIVDPVFKKPVLYIERLANGRTNLQEMPGFLEKKAQYGKAGKPAESQAAEGALKSDKKAGDGKLIGNKRLPDIVKLPENFILKDGKAIFSDGMVRPGPYTVTFENVDANLRLKLNSSYTKALNVATAGTGNINGKNNEIIKWDIKYDPTTPGLTISNRFNVSGVNIMTFLPYYDKYSPFAFRSGYFSGLLIFDFDNGNIGSTNEVRLYRLSFTVKQGYENAQYLETTVPDLVKYFRSSSGDVIFDFKIKGEMSNPQFYLGPISKQAVASMAIDKIGQALSQAAKQQAASTGPESAAKKTDVEKAAEYINMFKGLMKDKR